MSEKKPAPFQSLNDGKCSTCEESRPLDMMLRVDYKKGLYECIDCKVDKEEVRLSVYDNLQKRTVDLTINRGKLRKLIGWVFG